MSSNAYSLRSRGGGSDDRSEKRQRTDRHTDNFRSNNDAGSAVGSNSRVLYLGNIPKDWTESTVRSVVAGSGRIVDVRVRIDSTGRTKSYVFIEYETPQESQRGMYLLSQVLLGPKRKFKVEFSKEQYSDGQPKQVMRMERSNIPFYVQLPQEMIDSVPMPDGYVSQQDTVKPQQSISPEPQHIQPSNPKAATPMPDILTKASQYLPQFNPAAFSIEDKIAENLQALNPPQMIQLISTVKSLASTNPAMAQQIFSVNPDIPVATVQALLLMGLVDANVLTTALQVTNPTTHQSIKQESPLVSRPAIQQQQQQQPDPRWPNLPPSAAAKLASMPPQESATIAQVLQLDINVIRTLPQDQQQMIYNIRQQYLGV